MERLWLCPLDSGEGLWSAEGLASRKRGCWQSSIESCVWRVGVWLTLTGVLRTLEHGVPQEQAGKHPGTREKLLPPAASFQHPLSTLLQVATGEMFTGPSTSITVQNKDMWTGSWEAIRWCLTCHENSSYRKGRTNACLFHLFLFSEWVSTLGTSEDCHNDFYCCHRCFEISMNSWILTYLKCSIFVIASIYFKLMQCIQILCFL